MTVIYNKKHQKTILIVDDEDYLREILDEMLKELDYDTILASNGEEAVDIYEKNRSEIALVILDLNMPILNGKDTFIRLKKIYDSVKVLITTGYGKSDETVEILDMGARGVLSKPYDISDLEDKIASII